MVLPYMPLGRIGGATLPWTVTVRTCPKAVNHEVCACRILILGIFGQHASRVGLPSHHQMVEALAPDGADQSFDKAIPPRRAGRDLPVANAHGAKPSPEDDAILTVTVTDQVAERLIPGECFSDRT